MSRGFWTLAQTVNIELNCRSITLLKFWKCVRIWNLKRRNKRRLESEWNLVCQTKIRCDGVIPNFWRMERCRKDELASCGWFGFPGMEQIYYSITSWWCVEKVLVVNMCLKLFLGTSKLSLGQQIWNPGTRLIIKLQVFFIINLQVFIHLNSSTTFLECLGFG